MFHSFLLLCLLSFTLATPSEYTFHVYPSESTGEDAVFADVAGNSTVGNGFSSRIQNATEAIRVPYSLDASMAIPLDGYTRLAEIQVDNEPWTIHEDLTKQNGHLVFASKSGQQRVFPKTAEVYAPPADAKYPRYMGLSIQNVGMALDDVLATQLLKNGEPPEEQVRAVIPPILKGPDWTSFVGTVEANDVTAVYAAGGTKAYHANLILPEAGRVSRGRLEGYVGGWMPAIRKVVPVSNNEYFETVVFGDVAAPDPFIVQTWHRVSWIKNGAVTKVQFGHSYPSFSRKQVGPEASEFYKALFKFGEYWSKHLSEMVPLTLPDQSWADMNKYAFAKELMTRPGGVYPKYGAFDRDYGGSEYDGFQVFAISDMSSPQLSNRYSGHFHQLSKRQSGMGSLCTSQSCLRQLLHLVCSTEW
jgi:hypothetical protein